MADKKYFWLRLKRDFFKRHDIKIVESMPNGKDYILFYLKLLCESVDHNGMLRFSDTIPYSADMLSTITNTNVDIVKSAIELFSKLEMMDILDDGTLYMTEIDSLIGSETYWAEAKRKQRAKLDNVQSVQLLSTQEIDIEIDKDKDKDKKIYGEFKNVQLTDDEFSKLKERFPKDYINRIENLSSYLASKNKKYKSHYATILNWSRKETKNEPTTNSKYAFAEKDGLDNF